MIAEANVIEQLFSDKQILTLFMALSVPIVMFIGYFWHEIIKTRSDNELKRLMLERGMSAQEIEQVIYAGIEPDKKKTSKENLTKENTTDSK